MAFGANINNVVINGQSIVKVTPQGGSLTVFGYVAKPTAEAKSINYDGTRGHITAGHDWTLKWDGIQTRTSDWSDAIGNRQLDEVQIIGPSDTIDITTKPIFLNADLMKTFDNKADSKISCEVFIPGVGITTSQGYMVNSSAWS